MRRIRIDAAQFYIVYSYCPQRVLHAVEQSACPGIFLAVDNHHLCSAGEKGEHSHLLFRTAAEFEKRWRIIAEIIHNMLNYTRKEVIEINFKTSIIS